ncbi:MAG: hypothetical protein R3C59_07250 [Planctomycetaceae bacterium]
MITSRNRSRRRRYESIIAQALEPRLVLAANVLNSVVAVAPVDHADDYETAEFEELEELVEEAHEYGHQIQLQDHHLPDLVHDVIAHVADELLIPPTDLHQLVISSGLSTPNTESDDTAAILLPNIGSQDLETEAVDTETDNVSPSNVAQLTGLTTAAAQTNDQVDSDSQIESVLEDVTTTANERVTNSDVDGITSEVASDGSIAGVVSSVEEVGVSIQDASSDQTDGAAIDGQPRVDEETVLLTELPETAIGIRYGSAFGLLDRQIRLPFSAEQSADSSSALPAINTPTSASSGTALMVAAGLAAGIVAASNAQNSPAVHKIVRRIRRSIRPAV